MRIDFDWEETRPVGGSTAEPYRSFSRDGFSVRWSGRIIARFSESYTFHGEADDGIRVRVRATGTYTFHVQGRGSSRIVVEIDGEPIVELQSLGESGSTELSARLTNGAHAVRVVMVGGDLDLDHIEVNAVEAGR